jgi:PAS domain S-box-containing protein
MPARATAGGAGDAPSRYVRLRRNLAASFVLIGLLLAGIAAWSVVVDYQRRISDAELQTRVLVRALDGHVGAVLAGAEVTLREVARRLRDVGGAKGMERKRLQQLLEAQAGLVPSNPVIFVFSADGELLANSANPALHLPRTPEVECLARLRANPALPLCIARPIKSPVSGKWRIPISVALVDGDGRFDGVVGLGLDPESFRSFYRSLGLGDDYSLVLARSDGVGLSRYPWLEDVPGRNLSQGPMFAEGVTQSDWGALSVTSRLDGRDRLVSYHRHERYPLVIFASEAEDAILAPWQIDTVAKAAFVLLALLGLAVMFAVSMRQIRRLEASEADLLLHKFSIDQSAEMVFWIALDGRLRYANEAACVRTGFTRDELLGLDIFELCPRLTRERWQRSLLELGSQHSQHLLEGCRTREGDIFPLDVFVNLVEYGSDTLVCANARDVSAQREVETALRESELRYRSTVDALQEGILVRDHERILACNPSAARIFGLAAERIVGLTSLTPLVRFYDAAGNLAAIGSGPAYQALRSGSAQYGYTYRLERPDGTSLWVEASASPLFRAGELAPYRVVATYDDITQRRQAEVALRASEEKFSKVFELIPEVVTVTDLDSGHYVDMNQAWVPVSGYTREEALGRTSVELAIWADFEDRRRLIEEVHAKGAVRDREIRFRRKDGSIFLSRLSSCVFEVQGRKLLLLIVRDITEQAQAEAARRAAEVSLRESEERFDIAARNAEVGIWDWLLDDNRVEVSTVYAQLMNLPPGTTSCEPDSCVALTHPEDQERVRQALERALNDGGALDIEYRLPLAGGAVRWLRAQARASGGAGRGRRLTGSLQDITERKRVEDALAESEAKFRELFATSLDPIWIARVREDGRIEYEDWNQTQAAAVGIRAEDAIGKTPHELYPKWAADIIDSRWRECVAAGVPMSWEERWPLAIGKRTWFSSVVPIRNAESKIFRLAGVARDITDRMAAEARVRKLNEELEQRVAERTRELRIANQEMEAFSYSVSHDLRAPLRAIEGFSALLTQDEQSAAQGKAGDYLVRIRAAALRMGRLIDDMLNLSRVGRHQLSVESFDLAGLAREVFEEVRAADPARPATLNTSGDLRMRADLSLLRIALTNLIGNAWKFSAPKGETRIELSGERDAKFVTIAIRDNGVGFDPAYSARLFGAFQRLHTEKEFAGSGIGLAIVQRIVHRHGGEITASSEPGAGASFIMRLPLVPVAGTRTRRRG